MQFANQAAVLAAVKEYYGKRVQHTSDVEGCGCGCSVPPSHVAAALKHVPQRVTDRFYGCGNPLPAAIEGLNVLDLGSGSGRDCYVAALMVGPRGTVTGIDMTEEQLAVARECQAEFEQQNAGKVGKMRFLNGYIEDIIGAGVAEQSMDLIISNCVVNLSPNKLAVLQGAFRALKVGGEFHFSDVYVDRRLPQSVREHEMLYGQCLGGALYIGDFISLARRVGFNDPRELSRTVINVQQHKLRNVLGNANFYSITYRLFKLPELEDRCEDYGQVATYEGTLPGSAFSYKLDDHHVFEAHRPMLVCGNTASMLQDTRLKPHFTVMGNRATHYGAFPCAGPVSTPCASSCASGSACAEPCDCASDKGPVPAPASASSCGCSGGKCC